MFERMQNFAIKVLKFSHDQDYMEIFKGNLLLKFNYVERKVRQTTCHNLFKSLFFNSQASIVLIVLDKDRRL